MSRQLPVSKKFYPTIQYAMAHARFGDPEAIIKIGELGNAKDDRNRGALHFAAQHGLTSVCQYLMEKLKLDVNEKDAFGESPLSRAASERRRNTAIYLVESGAALHTDGISAIHWAARNGDIELLKIFLQKGVSVDLRDSSRITILGAAAYGGQVDAVKYLLERHASPNGQCGDRNPPLACAIVARSIECVKLLIKAGADVNIIWNCDGRNVSPLHFAANTGNGEIIKCLLEAQANPDALSDLVFSSDPDWFHRRPRKPIEVAATGGREEAVEILLPVTKQIADIPEWSVDGIIRHMYES